MRITLRVSLQSLTHIPYTAVGDIFHKPHTCITLERLTYVCTVRLQLFCKGSEAQLRASPLVIAVQHNYCLFPESVTCITCGCFLCGFQCCLWSLQALQQFIIGYVKEKAYPCYIVQEKEPVEMKNMYREMAYSNKAES